MAKQWYIVHTYSGFEQKVKASLEERIKAAGKAEYFGQILVPTEKVVELVKGERRSSSRKFYPGYILVQMELNDETWHLVRHTPKVTGFIGSQEKPIPLTEEEAQAILQQMEEGVLRPRPKYQFEKGDEVRVVDGPFASFHGVVDQVIPEKGKVRVLVTIFGRSTPVELDFVQVNRL
ncbi:transcription termination/antitermination protein NusG [Desulfosoma caldarium]|uniref:Transcription termination/antitermination protein NusG n=1 Tax=Desulfosoma caldarium TaxID=610254 RepID=A0A3N1VFW5_9BACT|nr:transcription termination/antitermination protein NusG [Desulfosoma caldarium]ROR01746.1 transcription antitermination protein nusG [Desulfosoma caldarium]